MYVYMYVCTVHIHTFSPYVCIYDPPEGTGQKLTLFNFHRQADTALVFFFFFFMYSLFLMFILRLFWKHSSLVINFRR